MDLIFVVKPLSLLRRHIIWYISSVLTYITLTMKSLRFILLPVNL